MGDVLDVDPFDVGFFADPYPVLERLRAERPVFFSPTVGGWVLTRYADIDRVSRDNVRFSSANASDPLDPPDAEVAAVLRDFGVVPTMLNADPPVHTRIRAVVGGLFRPARVAQLDPAIRALADRLIDALPAQGHGDLVGGLAFPLPALVVFTFLGFPERDMDQLKRWTTDRLGFMWGRLPRERRVAAAHGLVEFWRYCQRAIDERRSAPQDDFAAELAALVPDRLTAREAASVLFGLAFAGHETTTCLIGNLLLRLLSVPERWRAVRADPTTVPAVVREALRYDPTGLLVRRVATEDVTLGGQRIRRGDTVCLAPGAGNRDPDRYRHPQEFDPGRADGRTHLSFGRGPHYCIGAGLALRETEILLEALLRRTSDLRLDPDDPVSWAPNLTFRGPRRLPARWTLA